jgi:hypothetical protein
MKPERQERGGPCWLLKLRWMGTQRVQMKGVLWFVGLVVPVYNRCLSCLDCSTVVSPVQIISPHRQACWVACLCVSEQNYHAFLLSFPWLHSSLPPPLPLLITSKSSTCRTAGREAKTEWEWGWVGNCGCVSWGKMVVGTSSYDYKKHVLLQNICSLSSRKKFLTPLTSIT